MVCFRDVSLSYSKMYALDWSRYLRDFEVETIGMKETSRRCSDENCRARLKDTVLDWEVGHFSLFWQKEKGSRSPGSHSKTSWWFILGFLIKLVNGPAKSRLMHLIRIVVSIWKILIPTIVFVLLFLQDALPPKEMNQAEKHCRMADVVLCLGTR